MPYIVQHLEGGQSRIHVVPRAALRIGRGTNADLRLDDPTVALDHAVIEERDGAYHLVDLGGVTGTYVNGRPIQEAALAAEDVVTIGSFQIRVQVTHPDDPLFLAVRARSPEAAAPPSAPIIATPPSPPGEPVEPPSTFAPAAEWATQRVSAESMASLRALAQARYEKERSAAAPATAPAAPAPPPAPAAPSPAPSPAASLTPPSPPAAPPEPPPAASPESDAWSIAALAELLAPPAPPPPPAVPGADVRPPAAPGSSRAPAPEPSSAVSAVPPVPPAPPAASPPGPQAAQPVAAPPSAAPPTAVPSAQPAAGSAVPPAAAPAIPAAAAGAVAPSAAAPLSRPPAAPGATPPSAPAGRPPAPPAGAPPGGLRPPTVDYVAAFSLRRPFFNKTLLALGLTAAAAAAMLALPLTGRSAAFEPGGVHRWHAGVTSCASCHAPWRGPRPTLCADCHATQRLKGEVHQARQVAPPPCTSCHPEHRGGERLAFVDDSTCASCHADLRVTSGTPRFARSVRTFRDDHPEFSVTLPDGTRMPLAVAVERRADPTPLRFNHQQHLRAGLPTPSGQRVQLACESCHRLAASATAAAASASPAGAPGLDAARADAAGGTGAGAASGVAPAGATGIVPVTYRESCTTSGCHPLTFDDRRPNQVAPHDTPERVREFLVSVYTDRRGSQQSIGQQYRLLVRSQGAAPRGLDFSAQSTGAVVVAERYLYSAACRECHQVDASTEPPVVAWTPIPERWLPNARFSHLDHRTTPCLDCHAAAPASTATADVLIPGIAVCRRCHGAGGTVAGGVGEPAQAGAVPARPARDECISCHGYHPRNSGGGPRIAAAMSGAPSGWAAMSGAPSGWAALGGAPPHGAAVSGGGGAPPPVSGPG